MLSFKLLGLAALAGLPSAVGYIYALTAPSHASPGQQIRATLSESIYIQNWDDFGIIWGLLPAAWGSCAGCVGSKIGYTNLV